VTVRTLPGNTQIKAIDSDTGQFLASDTTDSNGVAEFRGMPNSNHTVVLTTGNTPPSQSNADPDGTVSTVPTTLSVDIDDADFSSDSVTVEIAVDGTVQQTTTLNSAGSVSYTTGTLSNGTHTWTVNATDSFGASSVQTYSVNVPGQLNVYNESSPNTLITQQVNATFYNAQGDIVRQRSTTTGSVDLQGLPVQDYTVVLESNSYRDTTVYIPDIAGDTDAFMLPSTVSTSEIVFELDDSTGRFDADSTSLEVQRARNTSGTLTYETVVSDQFDAAGQVPTELVNGERYRLIVTNDANQTRILGSYTPTSDALVPLPIGTVRLVGDSSQDTAFGAQLDDTASGRVIRVQYRDPNQQTTDLRITITEYGNSSNVLINNQSVSGPFGRATATFKVPSSAPDDISYRVEYEAVRTGDDATGEALVGDIPPIAQSLGLAPNVLSLLGWGTIMIVTGLIAIASAQLATVVATLTATLLTILGAVAIPFPLLGIAGAIAFLSNFGRLST
jgi:hypothetical protein